MADNSKNSSSSNAPSGGSGASTAASSSSKLNATAAEFVPKSVAPAAPVQQQSVNMPMEMFMQPNNPMMMNYGYGYAVPAAYGYGYQAYPDYNMQPNQVQNNATANGGSAAIKTEEVGNTASASSSNNSIGGYKDALQKGSVVAAPATEKGKVAAPATEKGNVTTSSAEAAKTSTPAVTTVNAAASSTASTSTDGDTSAPSANTAKEDSNAKKNVTIETVAATTETENKWRRPRPLSRRSLALLW